MRKKGLFPLIFLMILMLTLSYSLSLTPVDYQTVTQNPEKFDWEAVEGAVFYNVYLVDSQGEVTKFVVPEEKLSPERPNIVNRLWNIIVDFFRKPGVVGYAVIDISYYDISDEFWNDLSDGEYSWMVEAIDKNANVIRELGPFHFTKETLTRQTLKTYTSQEVYTKETKELHDLFSSLSTEKKKDIALKTEEYLNMYYMYSDVIDSRILNVSYLSRGGYLKSGDYVPVIVLLDKSYQAHSFGTLRNQKKLFLINGFAGDVRIDEIGSFASVGDVRGVYLDEVIQLPDAPDMLAGGGGGGSSSKNSRKLEEDNRNQLIRTKDAWDKGYTGEGVMIAILDTGIDDSHPDLLGKVVMKKSFVSGEDETDRNGHGTHCASLAAGEGIVYDGAYRGVAPDAKLINAKVLDSGGSGSTSGIIEGMEWAINNGADIISMSLGGDPTEGLNSPLTEAANQASERGVVMVIAAGNNGWY